MTKKDYTRIASALYDARDKTNTRIADFMNNDSDYFAEVEPGEMWRISVENIADVLQADNEAFDRSRFYNACGYYANIILVGDKRK
jgi:uncharacterized membrane protein